MILNHIICIQTKVISKFFAYTIIVKRPPMNKNAKSDYKKRAFTYAKSIFISLKTIFLPVKRIFSVSKPLFILVESEISESILPITFLIT